MVFLEIQNVTIWSVFLNPVTYAPTLPSTTVISDSSRISRSKSIVHYDWLVSCGQTAFSVFICGAKTEKSGLATQE